VSQRARILAVDDQPENLELLGAILEEEGYEVEFAADGIAALEAVERQPPQAILLDLMMPRLDGIGVCRRLKGRRATCFIPILLLTALSDVESKVQGLESGADDFLNKPFHRIELLTRLRSLLRIRNLRDELDSTEAVIFSMVDLLEGKDPRTRNHSLRVAALVAASAARLRLPPRQRQDLIWGALLHDIGKLGVPEHVLLKPEPERDEEEERLYRDHPRLGARILAPIESLAPVVGLVAAHHERFDGSGYPEGLGGEHFDRGAELLAAANRADRLRVASPGDWVSRLRSEVTAGRFRDGTVAQVVSAAEQVPEVPNLSEVLPVPVLPAGGKVLVADDSPTNRQLYRELLDNAGYQAVVVGSGGEALAAWEAQRPDLLLLDIRMPDISGAEVCRRIKSEPLASWLPIVLITAYEVRDTRHQAIEAGADDLLVAPVNRTELLARVASLLRLRLFHEDLIEHESVVLSLSAALEAKDAYTRGHSLRVGELAARLALELGDAEPEAQRMRLGGALHDIGKVAVPERVLHKPGKLTAEEYAVVMTHPVVGWEICRRLRSAEPVLDVIRFHHERFDGSGYPDGLRGEAIPRQARILSVADAFDALTSTRPYRASLSPAEAIALLANETEAGKWERGVFEALVDVHRRGETDLRSSLDGLPEWPPEAPIFDLTS